MNVQTYALKKKKKFKNSKDDNMFMRIFILLSY